MKRDVSKNLGGPVSSSLLGAIHEQVFIENSYGYRPNRIVHTAIEELSKELQHKKYGWVVEAEIGGFFDNIDHY